MIRYEIYLAQYGWSVLCFIGYTANNTNEICCALDDIDCNGESLTEAYGHLLKDSNDRGLTYSNVKERRSVVAIGKSSDHASIVNTIAHELFHVVVHICSHDGIDLQSEKPCYIMGELCEKIFNTL